MIVHDVKQGSTAWLKLRAGIPTASEFHQIITPTGQPSKSAERYCCDLLAERILGRPLEQYVSLAMERGSELEAEAILAYEFERSLDTEVVGFVSDDLRKFGASPDRLVGDDGLLEIKCPGAGVHVGYMLLKPADRRYYPQIQGQLWISGRKWVDIMSYHPEMPRAIVRVQRDESYIEALSLAVICFWEHLESQWTELQNDLGLNIDTKKPEPEYLKPEDFTRAERNEIALMLMKNGTITEASSDKATEQFAAYLLKYEGSKDYLMEEAARYVTESQGVDPLELAQADAEAVAARAGVTR